MNVMLRKPCKRDDIRMISMNYQPEKEQLLAEIIKSELYLPLDAVRKYPFLARLLEPSGRLQNPEIVGRSYHYLEDNGLNSKQGRVSLDLLVERAEEYEKEGNHRKANEMYIKAIEMDPSMLCENEFPATVLERGKGSVTDLIKAIKEGRIPK